MRITELKLTTIELPRHDPIMQGDFTAPMEDRGDPLRLFYRRSVSPSTRPMRFNLLRIETDSPDPAHFGLTTGGTKNSVEMLAGDLIGESPLDHGKIWHKLWVASRYKHFELYEAAPFDNALWDLRAKIAGMSVSQLAGKVRDRVPCYFSTQHWYDIQDSVDEAREKKAKGWPGYKMHAYHGPEGDIETFHRVREAVGPEMKLMQDAAATYTYTEAVRVGRVLEKLDFHWFEEPLRDADLYGLAKLTAELDIPIAVSEMEGHELQRVAQHIQLRAGDIVRTDTARAGLSTVLAIAHTAEAFGMNVELTSSGSCFGLGNVHAIQSISNTTFFEDWDNQHPFHEAIGNRHVMRSEKGWISAPDASGWGLDPDPGRIAELTVEEFAV